MSVEKRIVQEYMIHKIELYKAHFEQNETNMKYHESMLGILARQCNKQGITIRNS